MKNKDLFLKMLAKAMGAYAKPLPDAGIIASWMEALKPYPLSIVAAAFAAYCDENGEFAPVPAGIAKRCKSMDGRLGAEEAWAIALTSRDEADTVVWTQEIAEAFSICQSVLEMGDEVGARMAFKDAYNRLITAARAAGKPAQWSASLGWDMRKREASLTKAAVAGLLPAPVVAGLLPAPEDNNARAQIAKIREMMSAMDTEKQRERILHTQRERAADFEAKHKANEMTANYSRGKSA